MTRGSAVALVLFGATLMSFVGLILRHIEHADGFQIMAYRSLSLALIVLVFACWRRGQGILDFFRQIDGKDCIVGFFWVSRSPATSLR